MRRVSILLGLLAVGLCAAVCVYRMRFRGVQVTVTNRGPQPVRNVVVRVTGRSYFMDSLDAGESKAVSVEPTGESAVRLNFDRSPDDNVYWFVDTYIDGSNYEGLIAIEIQGGVVVRSDVRIGLWPHLPWAE